MAAFFLVALACTIGCGPLFAQSPSPQADTVPVAVMTPVREAVTGELRVSGTLDAARSAGLSARVDGLVAEVLVDAGDTVRADDLLLELDDTLAQQRLRHAQAETLETQARLGEARRLVEEARDLAENRHLPRTELARREAELELATAALAISRAAEAEVAEQVRRHRLPAPFNGVIVRKATEAGEWVTRGTRVLELVSLDRVRLDVRVPQERFSEISEDTTVEMRPDALPGQVLPARIAARVPVSDANSRSFLVRLLIDAPEQPLLPGTSATATFRLPSDNGATPLVSRDALLHHPDGGYSLFVVTDEAGNTIAQRRTVVPGRENGESVQILSGLEDGERVVVRGNETLHDGQAVRILENAAAE